MTPRSRRLARVLVAAGLVAGSATGATWAAFTSTTTNPGNTFSAQRVFPAGRSTSAFTVVDAADSNPRDASSEFAAVDLPNYFTTQMFAASYSSSRYVDLRFNEPLPSGAALSSPTFKFTFEGGGGPQICFYFEIRRASTGAVLATHGGPSIAQSIACSADNTWQSTTTAIPSVSTTDIANDLLVRVYGLHSMSKPLRIDLATVTATYYGTPVTLHVAGGTDNANLGNVAFAWGPAAANDVGSSVSTSWSTAFATTRYVDYKFPSYVPSSATVTGATITHAYRATTAGTSSPNMCWYAEVYAGAALLSTHGSSASPISCTASTTVYTTDTVTVPAIDTATEANAVVLRVYGRDDGSRPSRHDLVRLTVDWSMS